MPEPEKLERGLGLVEATSLNMTFMVGIGPFVVIPFVIQRDGRPASLLAWVVGPMLAVLDGCVWAELGAAMPQAGGSYVFLREAYGAERWGRLMSFLYIWQTLFQGPLSIASGALGFADYSTYLVAKSSGVTAGPSPRSSARTARICASPPSSCCSSSCCSTAASSPSAESRSCFGVVVVGTILWLDLRRRRPFQRRTASSPPLPADGAFLGFFSPASGHASVQTVYSYLGYYNVCNLGGEMKNPRQQYSPRHLHLDFRHRHPLFRHADQHPQRDPLAGSGSTPLTSSASSSSAPTVRSGPRSPPRSSC